MSEQNSFKEWCIVELFGHDRLAGEVSEASIGGCNFIRVDVPAVGNSPAFTKYFGEKSIYSMSPITKELALHLLKSWRPAPISRYEIPQLPTGEVTKEDAENLE